MARQLGTNMTSGPLYGAIVILQTLVRILGLPDIKLSPGIL